MKIPVRLMPAALIGLAVGALIARFVIARPEAAQVQRGDAVRTEHNSNAMVTATSILPRRGISDALAWTEFLSSVLPSDLPVAPSEIEGRIALLARQACVGNPVRAEVEREQLLAHVPIASIPSLLRRCSSWPNLDTSFSLSAPLLGRWAASDPQGALAALKQLPPELANRGVEAILANWVAKDSNEAFEWLANCQDPFLKTEGNRAAVAALARVDPAAAIGRANTLEPEARAKLYHDAVGAWAEKDVPAAMAWIASEAPAELRAELVRAALNVWAVRQPSEAIDYLLQLPPDARTASALVGPFEHLALAQPDQAVQKLTALPKELASEDLLESTARYVANSFALSGEKEVARALSLADQMSPGEPRNAFWAGLVKFGADNNVEFALSVLPRLPEGTIRESAVSHLVGVWAKQDARAAGEWINTLPPSVSRDVAAGCYADAVLALNPRAGTQWIESMADRKVQPAYAGVFYSRWREKDPVAANSWLQQTPALTEQQKAVLLERPGP